MTSGRGKDRSDLERTNCINATRTDCGTKLWAATRHAPGLGTARVTRFMAGADEPYEGILHVRICGGRRGQPRLLPGSQRRAAPGIYREVAARRASSDQRGSSFGGERTPGGLNRRQRNGAGLDPLFAQLPPVELAAGNLPWARLEARDSRAKFARTSRVGRGVFPPFPREGLARY